MADGQFTEADVAVVAAVLCRSHTVQARPGVHSEGVCPAGGADARAVLAALAERRAASGERFTEDDVKRYASVLAEAWRTVRFTDVVGDVLVQAVLSALAEDGRLLPVAVRFVDGDIVPAATHRAEEPAAISSVLTNTLTGGRETFEEFAVEDLDSDFGWPRSEAVYSLELAKVYLRNWERGGDRGRIVRRVTHRSPWQSVEDDAVAGPAAAPNSPEGK